jgi:hypothetical protein
MANTIRIKRSAVPNKVPTVADLQLGELAINTFDGKLYLKKDVGTASVVQIGGPPSTDYVLLDNGDLNSGLYAATSTDADQVVYSVSTGAYRTVKFLVQVYFDGEYQSTEILCVTNGTTVAATEYATIHTSNLLCTFTVDISGGLLRLLATPSNANTTFKIMRHAIHA